MFRPLLLLLLALLAAAATAPAQVITTGPDSTQVNTTAPTKKQLSAADSAARTERLFGLRLTRPQKAGYLALIPGAGQIYNKRWWKLPLVYGLLGGLGYGVYFEQVRFKEYSRAVDKLGETPLQTGQLPSAVLDKSDFPNASKQRSVAAIENGVRFYRRYRDQFILFSLGGYGLTILDALVDAHLRDFDVGDDLTLHWEPALQPAPGQPLPGVGLTASLSLK